MRKFMKDLKDRVDDVKKEMQGSSGSGAGYPGQTPLGGGQVQDQGQSQGENQSQDQAQDQSQHPYTPMHPVQAEKVPNGTGPVAYPAEVVKVQRLGFFVDTNNMFYPRDIGRSSWTPNGGVVLQFGDTFVWDGPEGNPHNNYKGVSVATAAVVQNPQTQPLMSHYMDARPDATVPVNPPYVQAEGDNEVLPSGTTVRVGLWPSGGIVFGEVNGDVAKGYCFFEKTHIGKGAEFTVDIQHTEYSIAEFNTKAHEFKMSRPLNGQPFFHKHEPSFGAFSSMYDDGYAYLYGGWGKGGIESKTYVARVPYPSIEDRSKYEYWDGTSWQSDVSKTKDIISFMTHGTIHKSKLFPPNTGKDYVFFGCSFLGDSKVHIGTAPRPEGPWDVKELFRADPDLKKNPQTYCMFAHPWAFNEEDGEMLISWSEGGMAGKVVAAKITLKKE